MGIIPSSNPHHQNELDLLRFVSLQGKPSPLWERIQKVFGSSLIGYWPLWETAGAVAEDISGNNRDGAYTNAALADLTTQLGKAPYFDGTAYVDISGASLTGAINGSLGSVVVVCKIPEAAFLDLTYRKIFRLQADTNNRIQVEKYGSNRDSIYYTYRAGGTMLTTEQQYISTLWAGLMVIGITWNKAADRARAFLNGAQVGADLTGLGNWAGACYANLIGVATTAPTEPWQGWIQLMALGNAELTPANMANIASLVRRKLVVFEGDSRTAGTGATNLAYNYPSLAARKLSGNWKCANVGDSGQPLTTMITEIDSELNQPGSFAGKVCVLWGGVNDNDTPASMHASISTWCGLARAKGYKVVVCTEIDCQLATHTEWHNTNYQALNDLIRANYAGYADGLADLGANANLQDATDTTYFLADKAHLTDAGYEVVAGIVATAINSL
jgi:lysophospholipase L1-like esterase